MYKKPLISKVLYALKPLPKEHKAWAITLLFVGATGKWRFLTINQSASKTLRFSIGSKGLDCWCTQVRFGGYF
jgi:hypothetical protein